ncbi:MAG: insulinase family protein, partial [Candidatus Coatesbacteria bacterium]|nr:insulinase family protein [Candidatus Coatesbacteria bacterium]
EIRGIGKDLVTDEELAVAKGMCLATEQVHRRQTPTQQSAAACLGELYGLGYDSYLDYGKKIETVTAEDVRRVARKYFGHYVQVTSVPESSDE